jgi:hypothetical protein
MTLHISSTSFAQDGDKSAPSGSALVLAIVILFPTVTGMVLALLFGAGLASVALIYLLGIFMWFVSIAYLALRK